MHFLRTAGLVLILCIPLVGHAEHTALVLKRSDYEDRVHAAWLGQILGVLLTLPYEHKVSSVLPVDRFPKPYASAIVDDDWYYEMVALRGFEQHGPELSVDQLGALWLKHNCGTWGSSKYALRAMRAGVKPSLAGHPKNNRLWWTIGPMFTCELYGILAAGAPNLAASLARDLGRINGYGEGLDGGVLSAGLVSVAFREKDSQEVVRQAARLIHADSPLRQAVNLVVGMADGGKSFREICDAIEDRWHIEYPATNNGVANAAILAACVWFGEGKFAKSVNLAASAADFVDTDNIAATACAVVGAMHGTQALPADLLRQLDDRIVGESLGGERLTPAVDERISDLARRTALVGERLLSKHGGKVGDDTITVPWRPTKSPLTAQRFRLADLMQYWNRDWTLERAGFGGGDGGMPGIRGLTYLDGDTLATYPRDEIRALVIRRAITPGEKSRLKLQAGVDPGRAWNLQIYLDNKLAANRIIDAAPDTTERQWTTVEVDLTDFRQRVVHIRLLQRVLVDGKVAGTAYWRGLQVD
ncbi:MAG: ADP-ribosylglycohydrolase family protein [Acidobacteriota bacterium]